PSTIGQITHPATTAQRRGDSTFHLTCAYQTNSIDALLWYQVWEGQGPELLSYQAGTGPRPSGRITTHLNTTGKFSVLQLEEVQLSDTALYLCAVQ
ncbi:TVA12 protein, partial [Alaudala cheleensis]|nr:TVA12 protein [Alaudala cheleensis]